MGILTGGLLAVAAGSNGRLLNNPYYFTGIMLLGIAVFSLPAVVPEFRCGGSLDGCSTCL